MAFATSSIMSISYLPPHGGHFPSSDQRAAHGFIARVADRMRTRRSADLDRQVRVVLALLGARLERADVSAVAAQLAPDTAQALTAHPDAPKAVELQAFVAAVSARHVTDRTARATCLVLAETLNEQGRCHLRLAPLQQLLE